MQDRLARDLPIDTHALIVAAWMRYVAGTDEAGRPIDVRDPMAHTLKAIAEAAGSDADRLVPAFLAERQIFGELGNDLRVRSALLRALERLVSMGAGKACQ